MAIVHDSEHDSAELRRSFAAMDAGDEAGAVRAMKAASAYLRQRDVSFRQLVQRIEERGLLLPSKIGAAIQLMDSTTLSEAESALAGARRLMKGCGLTFERIVAALEHRPEEADEIEQLRRAHQLELERSCEMAAELEILRANAAESGFRSAGLTFKDVVLVATLLSGLALAASIVDTITGPFRTANADDAQPAPASEALRAPVVRASAPPPPPVSNCWRDRSIRGACF